MILNRKIVTIMVVAALALGFWGGFSFKAENIPASIGGKFINTEQGQPTDVDFSLFWKVYGDLKNKYVDSGKLDTKELLYGAISGLVNSAGDPYTVFFEPAGSQKFQEEISGTFGGVGIEIGKRNNVLTVISPLKDTPAYQAGIKAGEKILKIDGKLTDG